MSGSVSLLLTGSGDLFLGRHGWGSVVGLVCWVGRLVVSNLVVVVGDGDGAAPFKLTVALGVSIFY